MTLAGRVSVLILTISACLPGQLRTVKVPEVCWGNPYASQPDPNASKTELQRYYDEETRIKQQDIQAHTDYENDKLRCKGSSGSSATACLMQAGRNFQRAQANVAISRNNNNNIHTKALIDIQGIKDECNVTGNSAAERQENMRHFRAQIGIKKQAVDVETKYANAKLQCGSAPSQSRTCVQDAGKQYRKDKIEIEILTNKENATWLKNRTAILRNETRPK